MLTIVCFFRKLAITKKAQRQPYNTRSKSKMGNEEGVQEQMKVDMSALKDQMASMTETMLKIQKSIEDNVTAAASNTAREAEPVLQPAINLGRDRNTTVFGRRYSPQAYCHTLISSGDLCLMTCDHSLVLVRCLAPIIRQFMKFQDMPKNQKKC